MEDEQTDCFRSVIYQDGWQNLYKTEGAKFVMLNKGHLLTAFQWVGWLACLIN